MRIVGTVRKSTATQRIAEDTVQNQTANISWGSCSHQSSVDPMGEDQSGKEIIFLSRMDNWKRLLLKSMGLGIGIGLGFALALGSYAWYSSRPKPSKA